MVIWARGILRACVWRWVLELWGDADLAITNLGCFKQYCALQNIFIAYSIEITTQLTIFGHPKIDVLLVNSSSCGVGAGTVLVGFIYQILHT